MSDNNRKLIVEIDMCKSCTHAGMYYTDCVAMHYRNCCEHPSCNGKIWIHDGESIPEGCPLPMIDHPKHETVDQLSMAMSLLDEWDNDYDPTMCSDECDCVWCKTRRFLIATHHGKPGNS